ncbi:MAG: hypothetical protein LBP50_00430 [Tannerella sp.]|jgi:hypothetical protein|nr:hypothetical protein [Tannerella sp.]
MKIFSRENEKSTSEIKIITDEFFFPQSCFLAPGTCLSGIQNQQQANCQNDDDFHSKADSAGRRTVRPFKRVFRLPAPVSGAIMHDSFLSCCSEDAHAYDSD